LDLGTGCAKESSSRGAQLMMDGRG
jgi:hypothetical protein